MNISRIVAELERGNLIIMPTDTIYGILADALNEHAVAKVKIAKRRNINKPLLLLVSDLDMLYTYTGNLGSLEQKIITKYLPGKLTILLPKNPRVPDSITGGSPLVGIRIPDHSDLLKIIRRLGRPLISTSVNLAGEPPIASPSQLSPTILKHIAYVEDVGDIEGLPSTLIKVEGNRVVVLRPGLVSDQIPESL